MPTYYDSTTGTSTWGLWVDGTSTATSTATTDPVWAVWTTASTTTTSTVYDPHDVWVTWTSDGEARVVDMGRVVRRMGVPAPETSEQRERRVQEARERQERYELERQERLRKEQEADARAYDLLYTNLTDVQRAELKEHGFFFVGSKRPGRKYRIRKGRVGNVDVIENDVVKHRLCAHPDVRCPDDDTRLAQKLMLEHMEDRFIGLANVHPARH